MAQRTITVETPKEDTNEETTAAETTPGCCHHWVIQAADGPVSIGSCQVCGETREFKNYVESATWGDGRTAGKGSSASAASESTSDDADTASKDVAVDGPDASDMESEE